MLGPMLTPEARRNIARSHVDHPTGRWVGKRLRVDVEAMRAEDVDRIREIDASVAPLATERRQLVRRVERANRVLNARGAHYRRPEHWNRPEDPPRPFDLAGTVAPSLGTLRSGDLQSAVVRVLTEAGEPLGVGEVLDVLALTGLRPAAGNASQAVWNALRGAIRRGEVVKVARNRYEAVPPTPTIGCVSDESPVHLSRQGPPETVLPPDPPEAAAALHEAMKAPDAVRRDAISDVVRRWPAYLEAWARLGELGRDDVESYACFRVGYHRGLDRLRQSGWRGSGYVRWEHETNRGFLLALQGLQRAAAAIGEDAEAERCAAFLAQLDPSLG